MFIKELVLDGFKSYATRTVIKGFDPKFNAITGLNGSGKSNILDSICFVLGITQLSQVRVANLQGLVYKNGQAGVTKASVCIIFDNSDKEQSPLGYEKTDEIAVTRVIVIGGKNKYMINGRTVQASQVQNLFHSVQLNVNNPHFLIMQGRITKVLNMKPIEILGMVEEAAGTRMYQLKKEQAEKIMKKKQVEIDEIKNVLTQEVTPKLEKLRQEKRDYLKFSSVQEEIEKSEKYCTAFKYFQATKDKQKLSEEISSFKTESLNFEDKIASSSAKKEELVKEFEELSNGSQAKQKEVIKELNGKENSTAKTLAKVKTQEANARKQLERSINAENKIETQEQQMKTSITDLKASQAALEEDYNTAEASLKEARILQKTKQDNLQAVSSGLQLASDGEKAQTLLDALMQAKNQLETTAASNKELNLKTKHSKKDLESVENAIKSHGASRSSELVELEKAEHKIKACEAKLLNVITTLQLTEAQEMVEARGCDAIIRSAVDKIETEKMRIEQEVAVAKSKLVETSSKVTSLQIQYDKRNVKFSPKEIKGIVAELFTVEDARFAVALEAVAGRKLHNLVVTNDQVGKELLQRGRLKRRTTVLPLNRIKYRPFAARAVERARTIASSAGASVELALNLLEFDPEVGDIMGSIFGFTLVCDKLSIARKIAFDKSVRMRVVTVDGDVVDPNGILSGGSRRKQNSIIQAFSCFHKANEAYSSSKKELDDKVQELKVLKQASKSADKLVFELNLEEKNLSKLQAQILTSEQGQLQHKKKQLMEAIASNEALVKENTTRIETLREEIAVLEKKKTDKGGAQKKALKEAEDLLQEAKKSLKQAEITYQKCRKDYEGNKQEIKRFQADLKGLYKEKETIKLALENEREILEEKETSCRSLEEENEKIKEEILEKQKLIMEGQGELGKLQAEISAITEETNVAKLEFKKRSGAQERLVKELRDIKQLAKKMEKQFAWIARDRDNFGKAGGAYEFKKSKLEKAEARLVSLKDSKGDLSRKLNKRVMGMIERAESEFTDLNEKRRIIEKDKTSLKRTISNLDEQKNKTLFETYQKVNKDFGSIFNTLLKGAEAKLMPYVNSKRKDTTPEEVLEGLEVKVAFSKGVWKESLSELSGGQRSLLALSLILSFLLFKPAPMYILDEVDAALDLSHTQNIGIMLRRHFKQSQFVVVSLKEGMFNNANVIFRTKFVDGVSTVRRTLGQQKQLSDNAIDDNDKENISSNSMLE